MAVWQFLAILLVSAAAQALPSSRVIGGIVVPLEAYSSIVQVEFNNAGFFWTQQCGGCILNSVWILSAAHCFSGTNYTPASRRIRAGSAIRNEGGVTALVSHEINHPTYGQNEMDGDICVVRLADPLTLGPLMSQAALMAPQFVLPAGLLVTYAGWGVTSVSTGEYSNELRVSHAPVVDREVCRQRYAALSANLPVTENMICAGDITDGGLDGCTGDGGGPLFFITTVTGIISWGNGCGRAEYPGVSTQISSYTNWIVATAV